MPCWSDEMPFFQSHFNLSHCSLTERRCRGTLLGFPAKYHAKPVVKTGQENGWIGRCQNSQTGSRVWVEDLHVYYSPFFHHENDNWVSASFILQNYQLLAFYGKLQFNHLDDRKLIVIPQLGHYQQQGCLLHVKCAQRL